MNTKHDIGRRYNKIVRKIKNFADDYAEACADVVHEFSAMSFDDNGSRVRDAKIEARKSRKILENYVEQSLRDFRKMIENKEDLP